jgi:RHS repeat-associated protein
VSGYTVNIYTPSGQKLAAYTVGPNVNDYNGQATPFMGSGVATSDQYFGSRRLAPMDQLGSVGTYFPWGENRGSTNPQDTWSFATYWQDSVSGLDYANNRYYSNAYGRFTTPDPSAASRNPSSPQSWNRYPYVLGDPVNANDPMGLDIFYECPPDECGGGGGMPGGGNFQDSDGYCDPSQGPGFCGNPCVGVDGTPAPGPFCQIGGPQPTQAPTPQPAPPPPPIYCEPDVIAAMKKAWQQSANGTSGQEAGFSVNGTTTSYSITSTGANTTNVPCTAVITITPTTFAVFHVHPNGCQPQPSTTDINAANNGQFDIYSFSTNGLWEYDPATGQSVMLRSGMSWTQPCPTN